jgi:threonine synthase
MGDKHGCLKALKCRECGREYPLEADHVCEFDFGPLEVAYDYDRIKKSLTREVVASRPKTMWRYRELLPVAHEPTVGLQAGFAPLIKADRLAKKLGIRELWIKNDAVNYPSLPFKVTGKSGAFPAVVISATPFRSPPPRRNVSQRIRGRSRG